MDIGRTYIEIVRRLKDFLLSERSREFFIFMFFVFIASAFWLMQTLDSEYETDIKIPIRLRDVPENIVITTDLPSDLVVHVRDKGVALLNYQLTRHFYPLNISFPDYKERNNHVALPSSEFQRAVAAQLGVSTQITSIKPDTLDFYYSEGKAMKVPVRLQGKVSAGLQYYLSDTIFSPDSVLVYSTADGLDTIKSAFTEYVEYAQIEDTILTEVSLQHGRGVKFVPERVSLKLPVDIYTEKTVEIPVQGVNFPAGKTLRAFPSKVKVTFQIGLSQYLKINAEDRKSVV